MLLGNEDDMDVAFLQQFDAIAAFFGIYGKHAAAALLFLRKTRGFIGTQPAILWFFVMFAMRGLIVRRPISKNGLETQPAKQHQS